MTIYYTSDLHFGHASCAERRGFKGSYEHDNYIVDTWNSRITDDDTVWVLGDVCLSSSGYTAVGALRGIKRLITGNHDAPHPMHRDSHKAQEKWRYYFPSIQPYARRKVQGVEFLMSHHPYEGDHTPEDRDVQWRLPDYGIPILHGHVHSTQQFTRTVFNTPQIHVGWDAWGSPVQEEIVIDLIKGA